MSTAQSEALDRFRHDYGAHRAAEGRGYSGDDLLGLPYVTRGRWARQWSVRARSFDAFVARVVVPLRRAAGRSLHVLDLGAGNGWLSYRLALAGDDCVAIDIRDDDVDGLGAAVALQRRAQFACVSASFDTLPVADGAADLAVFNAALHYATDLAATLREAVRAVRPGGEIAVLDSPFYARAADGMAMVAEKHAQAANRFGARADSLLALPFIEYLTAERLAAASTSLGLTWHRQRVRYPLWYEVRPLLARLRGQRRPSRFDLWTARVA
ncbi:MAG: methyltransferase domain-containing protein [Sphingomonas sp.]|jgi:SAM-dependent methyltransferase|uniref:class I SAM-dependent methyltransferase n=1 Tax=Sphingomonas sp. TaxID=28214 RepID=UPI003561A7DD